MGVFRPVDFLPLAGLDEVLEELRLGPVLVHGHGDLVFQLLLLARFGRGELLDRVDRGFGESRLEVFSRLAQVASIRFARGRGELGLGRFVPALGAVAGLLLRQVVFAGVQVSHDVDPALFLARKVDRRAPSAFRHGDFGSRHRRPVQAALDEVLGGLDRVDLLVAFLQQRLEVFLQLVEFVVARNDLHV